MRTLTQKCFLATAVIAIVSALTPWYASYLSHESLVVAEAEHGVEALHIANKAVRINPLSINSLFILAGAQQRLGKQADAQKTLQKATELQPLNYATWEQLARYERDYWHQPELAQEHLARALALNPWEPGLKPSVNGKSSKT